MLEVIDVSKRFHAPDSDQAVLVLKDLNFRVQDGEFVCLLGPSGCGKTTLLNLLAGFLRPSRGRLLFQGHPIAGPGPDRGVVFQESALFPWLTALENVAFGLRNTGESKGKSRLKAMIRLKQVGLEGYEDARPHFLSGGMRQRVALARVLALEPALLLMDEPFGALDENTRERLQDELLRLWETGGQTVVFVTHNVREAAYLADRVLILGPPPFSLTAEVRISLPRPRLRSGFEMQMFNDRLRAELGRHPCCIPAGERRATNGSDSW